MLLNIWTQKPTEPELQIFAINLINATKSFEYCWKQLSMYEQRVREEIKLLGGNPRLERIIDLLGVLDPEVDANKNAVLIFDVTGASLSSVKV
ncbi:hypothetical protein MVEG_10757 [Podila verticillata NRRL 6337]|nr:hypothetical protein MVEG_10757 [Podila verticillata NRRL 6337]